MRMGWPSGVTSGRIGALVDGVSVSVGEHGRGAVAFAQVDRAQNGQPARSEDFAHQDLCVLTDVDDLIGEEPRRQGQIHRTGVLIGAEPGVLAPGAVRAERPAVFRQHP
jgi:hypothetical protein